MKLIQQGAEAKIFLINDWIIKDRISKSCRHPELDKQIRKQRTKAETKLLIKAGRTINAPLPIIIQNKSDEQSEEHLSEKGGRAISRDTAKPNLETSGVASRDGNNFASQIKMPFINGEKLSEYLDKLPLKEQKQIMKLIGTSIAKLHKADIIHGDLTTSNMILVENEKNNFEKNLEELKKLDLPKKEYVIVGGGPLAIRNLRDTKDIDLIVTKKLWKELVKNHLPKNGKIRKEVKIINIRKIEIMYDPEKPEEEFLNNSETIEDFPFLTLEKTIEIKKEYGREKDKQDIILIKDFLKKYDEQKRGAKVLSAGGRAGISKPKVFFIDFGLGYISQKIEDKAVDLHLLKQALEAKHFKHFKELQNQVLKSYEKENPEAKKIFERITAVERRGRYRH